VSRSSNLSLPVCSFRRRSLSCLYAAIFLALFLSTAAVAQNPTQHHDSKESTTTLNVAQLVQVEIAAGQKKSYSFKLAQGQYTSIAMECRRIDVTVTIELLDPSGTKTDRLSSDEESSAILVEVAASQTGPYTLQLQSTDQQTQNQVCQLNLAAAREASERETSLQQARTLEYEASILSAAGKMDDALQPARQALDLREKLLGPEDASLERPLFVLGRTFERKADFKQAALFYERALAVQEKSSGLVSRRAWRILNNLSVVYLEMDELDKGESMLNQTLEIGEKVYGPDYIILANTLINMGNFYDEKADYSRAETFYERAVAIAEKKMGPKATGLEVVLANLAGVASERGDYEKAEKIAQRAVSIAELGGPSNPRLGLPLENLAEAYRLDGQPEAAEALYQRALSIYEKTLGLEHPLVADTLSGLGDIYRDRHDFERAESYYQRALAIRQKVLGEAHSAIGESLDHLGSIYRDRGDYARADSFYTRALAIRERVLGPEHPDVVETLSNLSVLQIDQGRFDLAANNLSRAVAISERNGNINLLAGSERQKFEYLKLLSSQLDEAVTLNLLLAPDQAFVRELAATTVLQRKSRVLDVLSNSVKQIREHATAEDRKLFDELDDVTSRLAQLVLSGPLHMTLEEHQKRVGALKDQREQLEAQISRRSREFRTASQPVTLTAIRDAIPSDAVLLEFLVYDHFLPQGVTGKERLGESRYAAYVIRASGEVLSVDLGLAKDIDYEVAAYRASLSDPRRTDVSKRARALYLRILQPIRASIDNSTHLLISTDGQLSLIPFESLIDPQEQYAVESYSITYLSTGRDLLRMGVQRDSKSGPVLIADPVFGEPGVSTIARPNNPERPLSAQLVVRRSITAADDLSNVYFAPLSGTAREAQAIQSLFPEAKALTGAQATKTALKALQAPSLLHIATHGFFLRDFQSNSVTIAGTRAINASSKIENPLLRSGLALSGANLNKRGFDNGILTALEASNLNLWGTKLVTLSACDTGVGEVKNGEGVYGLRRAFFLAGTESLVMSLWPVSDYVTRELMIRYYSGLKSGLGRGEALRQAQLAMLKRKGRQHPFYWASFIETGEWTNLENRR
jgi:CHAT domain-containing protein